MIALRNWEAERLSVDWHDNLCGVVLEEFDELFDEKEAFKLALKSRKS